MNNENKNKSENIFLNDIVKRKILDMYRSDNKNTVNKSKKNKSQKN